MAPIAVGVGSALVLALIMGLIGMRRYLTTKSEVAPKLRTSGASSWSRIKPNSLAGNTNLYAPDGSQVVNMAAAARMVGTAANYNRPGPFNQGNFLNHEGDDIFNQDNEFNQQSTVVNSGMPPNNPTMMGQQNEKYQTNPYATAFLNNEAGDRPSSKSMAFLNNEAGDRPSTKSMAFLASEPVAQNTVTNNDPFGKANPGFAPNEYSPVNNQPEQLPWPTPPTSNGFESLGQMGAGTRNRRGGVKLTRASTGRMPNVQPPNPAQNSNLPALSGSMNMDQVKQYAQRGLTITPNQNQNENNS